MAGSLGTARGRRRLLEPEGTLSLQLDPLVSGEIRKHGCQGRQPFQTEFHLSRQGQHTGPVRLEPSAVQLLLGHGPPAVDEDQPLSLDAIEDETGFPVLGFPAQGNAYPGFRGGAEEGLPSADQGVVGQGHPGNAARPLDLALPAS